MRRKSMATKVTKKKKPVINDGDGGFLRAF